MKNFVAALSLLCLAGCAWHPPQANLVFSGAFSLSVPITLLAGASLLSIDGITLKTAEGATLSGAIVTREFESLPESFPLQDYPEFILNKKDVSHLDNDVREFIAGVAAEIDHSYGLDTFVHYQHGETGIYRVCKERRCLGYIAKEGVNDHLLMIHSDGFDPEEFDQLIKDL